jgi:hypothetical protein
MGNDLINYKELSIRVTGSPYTIRKGKVTKKHRQEAAKLIRHEADKIEANED